MTDVTCGPSTPADAPDAAPTTSSPPDEVATVLARAAEVIERNGWHQGNFLDYEAAALADRVFGGLTPDIDVCTEAPVCTVGAIRIAGGADPDDWDAKVPAVAAFAHWLTDGAPAMTAEHEERPQATWLTDEDAVNAIGWWNDDPGRNAPQVIAALRQAAAEAVIA